MKGLREVFKKSFSENAIEELMLVKTALEEKNELIDQKDHLIRELYTIIENLEEKNNYQKNKLKQTEKNLDQEKQKAWEQGVESVIIDIINLITKYERKSLFNKELDEVIPIGKIISLLKERYGLQVLEEPKQEIDPRFHKIVEINKSKCDAMEYAVLANGYKIGKRIIKPVQLKVIQGDKNKEKVSLEKIKKGKDIVLLENACPEQKNTPDGVA